MSTNPRHAILRQLAAIPGGVLITAAAVIKGYAPSTKTEAIETLSVLIEAGHLSVADIINGTVPLGGTAPSPAPIPAASTVSVASANAAARAEEVALDAVARADRVGAQVSRLTGETQANTRATEVIAQEVTKLGREIAALRDVRVDERVIREAIRTTVESALGPVIEAAQANGTVAEVKAAAVAPEVRTVAEVFGISLNDIKGNPLTVEVWGDPEAPAVDPSYIWQESILRALVVGAQTGTNVWLGGEKGTGKTQAAMQWAARTGRAFTRINFHKYTSAEEYLGATGLINGQTQFVPGAFLTAYTRPGSVTLLDEVTNADPGELAPLNGALERGTPRVNIGGQVWTRAPGVMVIAADNTLTNGDASGRYAGTRTMNSALADRFGFIVPVTWLTPDQESAALVRLTGCSSALADSVVQVLTYCRAKAASGDLVDAPSIRSAISWIEAMPVLGVRAAWDIAVASRQPSESAIQLEAIYTAQVNESTFINDL